MTRCRICSAEYVKARPMQAVCGLACAQAMGQRKAEAKREIAAKAERIADKTARLNLSPISYFEKRAEKVVNEYVRLRDHAQGCISCNKPASWGGQWHASHFRSVGAASGVRFHLWNIHKACSECNHIKSGNVSEYLPRLIEKIGQEKVDWLKCQNKVKPYRREYLERLTKVMRKRVARLRKRLKQI